MRFTTYALFYENTASQSILYDELFSFYSVREEIPKTATSDDHHTKSYSFVL